MKSIFKRLIVSLLLSITSLIDLSAQGVYQLWGTTPFGGTSGSGTIFSLDSAGNSFKSRYSFNVQNPGFEQLYTKLAEWNGKLYGTTYYGGANPWSGVIFEWDPITNIYTKKYDFNDIDGAHPGDLTLHNGKFYGTTSYGGLNTSGVIFEWDPATSVYTKKLDLPVTAGADDLAGRLAVYNGKFYGTSFMGGLNGNGFIFEWDPASNIYTEIFDFSSTGAAFPIGGLTLENGKFYGMTTSGGSNGVGVIYEWSPATNIFTAKFDFSFSGQTGDSPKGNLTLHNAKFYGMATEGGVNGGGVIFQWDPVSNVYTKKFDFTTSSGIKPTGDLELHAGKFYGITYEGGANDGGTIFEWDPITNVFAKKIDMTVSTGSNSYGSLLASGGKLYGTTNHGGADYNGVIFEWDPVSNVYSKKIDLNVNKGIVPALNLAYKNGELYGITAIGGGKSKGVIFGWNTGTNQLTKRVDFGTVNGTIPSRTGENSIFGSIPASTLVEKDGKYYGITSSGGTNDNGVIFEWDLATNVYTKKIDVSPVPSGPPPSTETNMISGLVLANDKFYGTLPGQGNTGQGELFEWNPVTNIYTKKIDFTLANGSFPNAPLVIFNNKYYGTTILGGTNDAGVIFEWDPATNVYTKKIELGGTNGRMPKSGLVVFNNKLYGTTYTGGANDLGVLFEWDPVTNVFTKKIDLGASTGSNPAGSMIVAGQKLYGMATQGGLNDKGVIFEWDPVTNIYSVKHHFNGTDGKNGLADIILFNGLSLVPAPIAPGTPGSCASWSPVVIDNSNNNKWVPLLDANGDAVAEIKANGNNLGTLNYSLYVHNGAVREDGNHKLYLDRNLTITPQTQPATPVDVRLYISETEYQSLKNATNSQGQPSGINTINDVGFFKNGSNTCTATIQTPATIIPATGQAYNNGYVLTASITSFSTFYFAKNTVTALPLTLLDFNGKISANDVLLNWKTVNEANTSHFNIERSVNGRNFTYAGKVLGSGNTVSGKYHFTDAGVGSLPVEIIYYRLKQTEITGREVYSRIIALPLKTNGKDFIKIYPNPVEQDLSMMISLHKAGKIKWNIADNIGKTLKTGNKDMSPGSSNIVIDITALSPGIYYLTVQGTTINEKLKFIKQ